MLLGHLHIFFGDMANLLPIFKIRLPLCREVLSIKLETKWKLLVVILLEIIPLGKVSRINFAKFFVHYSLRSPVLISFPLIIGPLTPSVKNQGDL